MPTAHRTREIAASQQALWEVIGDPHHLPRWWPRVSRMEAVTRTGTGEFDAFTEVLQSPKGKMVRADFRLLERVEQQRIAWSQEVENTPFERVLESAETAIELTPLPASADGPATRVRIELSQELRGFRSGAAQGSWISGISRLGSPLVRRAAGSTLDDALDGLERIVGH
jgi:uncharacterized protein YndB with AHSA1/START domain